MGLIFLLCSGWLTLNNKKLLANINIPYNQREINKVFKKLLRKHTIKLSQRPSFSSNHQTQQTTQLFYPLLVTQFGNLVSLINL
ncbi:hypothetical protein DFP77_1411 [Marinomonas foliarum]|uniref:Uncharacterized protein n=2 Tax=Marinomonas TaxID=28253 RepID=A0A1M4VY37_9GAMM|nr:hypothetical protein DFP77_1411 [Marinomonas foliarum]SHE73820.1 hypothetical protein SAMN02745753_00775 [Marinomonas polaris DSM 16579]